jgi:transketolase
MSNDLMVQFKTENKNILRNILRISFEKRLSHIGSCLTAAPIIHSCLVSKKKNDPFILSSGHAGLALYCVLEELRNEKGLAEKLFDKHGVHPNRDIENDIWASSGSLGHGIGIGIGYALADQSITPHILISDGECSEGSIYEALRVAKEAGIWMNIFVNCNGYGAYKSIEKQSLIDSFGPYMSSTSPCLLTLCETKVFSKADCLSGLSAHYYVMNESDYKNILQELDNDELN